MSPIRNCILAVGNKSARGGGGKLLSIYKHSLENKLQILGAYHQTQSNRKYMFKILAHPVLPSQGFESTFGLKTLLWEDAHIPALQISHKSFSDIFILYKFISSWIVFVLAKIFSLEGQKSLSFKHDCLPVPTQRFL